MNRFPSLPRFSRVLPALLLLLATLSTVFWFGNERGLFYRWHPHHNSITSLSLTLADNLSPEHRFLGFLGQYQLSLDEPPTYFPYNRFPIVNHALVKLTMLPFGDDIEAKIYAARMLMLVFFVASGVLAWLSLRRLLSSETVALVATLLTFSSSRFLFFNDMVSMEIPSLFGVLLAFHGMTVFIQEGRFGQLLLKTGIAILLSLQIMSFILAFTALGLGYELLQSIKGHPSIQVRSLALGSRLATTLASSLYLRLMVMASLFFALIVGLPIFNESMVFCSSLSFFELPSFRSMLARTGIDPRHSISNPARLEWTFFLSEQLTRIGRLVIPYAALELTSPNYMPGGAKYRPGLAVLGAVVLAVCTRIAIGSRYRILMGTLLLSGWLWSLPVRAHSAYHVYDAIFYVGIPLIFWSRAFLHAAAFLERKWGEPSVAPFTAGSIAATVAVFCLSSFWMGKIANWYDPQFRPHPYPSSSPALVKDTMADFQTIREMTEPRDSILIAREHPGGLTREIQEELTGARRGVYFYLSGRIVRVGRHSAEWPTDYVLSHRRIESPSLLTPENRRVFLYDGKLLFESDGLRLSE